MSNETRTTPTILVQRLHPSAQLPRYAHTGPFGDLAADLFAAEAATLAPAGQAGSTQAVRTGLALELPSTHGALVEDRSGLALALRRRVPAAWLFAAVFLLVPAAYYVVTVQARFRHPLEPLICILGVYLFRSAEPR